MVLIVPVIKFAIRNIICCDCVDIHCTVTILLQKSRVTLLENIICCMLLYISRPIFAYTAHGGRVHVSIGCPTVINLLLTSSVDHLNYMICRLSKTKPPPSKKNNYLFPIMFLHSCIYTYMS